MKALFLLFFISHSALAINFFNSGEAVNATKFNEIISQAMKVYNTTGVSTFSTTSDTKVLVPGRTVVIEKKFDETSILINYSDVFRTSGAGTMCTIYLEIDGKICSNGEIFKSIYTHASYDINALETSGVCSGMPKGTYTAKVMVKDGAYSAGGYNGSTCEFSWNNNTKFSLSAQEVLGN